MKKWSQTDEVNSRKIVTKMYLEQTLVAGFKMHHFFFFLVLPLFVMIKISGFDLLFGISYFS